MEKPTGVIQKIIESLQQVNALDTYSPIEKDIILHNLRAAYMIFLNIKADEQSEESRVEKLFEESDERRELSDEEVECGEKEERRKENEEIEEEEIEEEPIEEEPIEEEPIEEEQIEEEQIEEEQIEKEQIEEEEIEEEEIEEEPVNPPVASQNIVLQDDLLEFIPDAKPQYNTLFGEMEMPKTEKRSLNDLLEKKEASSLGAKFQQSFIPDLTKAIAINEKFTFIRELFHNSGVDFSNAIQKLNECENIDDAFIFMEELKHQYLWDTTSSAYLSLCDLVRRRFI